MRVGATALEIICVEVPEAVLETFEAALSSVYVTAGFFHADANARWREGGVKPAGGNDVTPFAGLGYWRPL
jgi:hypothetical protein